MMITSSAILAALQEVVRDGRLKEYGGVFDRTQMDGAIGQWRSGPPAWKEGLFEEVAHGLVGKHSTPFAPGVPHDFKVYPGANHAFFNDTGPRYDKAAATDAWTRAVAWFHQYLPAG